jgi:hypothetical protein
MFNKIGSFKNIKVAAIGVVAIAGFALSSCKKEINGAKPFDNRSTSAILSYDQAALLDTVLVNADITTAVNWDRNHVWVINGVVTVRDGGSLTIEKGTYIKSTPNTPNVQNGVLVISKTGTIHATGTAADPIVFTSRRLLDNDASTLASPGQFGGVIILGNDTVNVTGGDKLIEGLADQPKFHYGGTIGADNRGEFQYVRIEYAGFQLAPNVEVNGLTLGGVGTGTTIDHVQVSYGLDDGFEFFGGSVNASYLVALGNDDDQYDFDNGYNGTINFAIALADANSTHSGSAGNSDSNGIESDNNAPAESSAFNLTPRTNPLLNHFTVIGTNGSTPTGTIGYKNGARIRRGSRVRIMNSIFTGYGSGTGLAGITFDHTSSEAGDWANSNISSSSIHGFTNSLLPNASPNIVPGSGRTLAAVPNTTASTFGIGQPFYNVTSPALNLFASTGTQGALFTTAPGSTNWIASWTRFNY